MLNIMFVFIKILYFVMFVFCGLGLLYKLQCNFYMINYILKDDVVTLKKQIFLLLTFLIIDVLIFAINLFCIELLIALLFLKLILLFITIDDKKIIKKIKFTKRIARLFFTYVFFTLLFVILVSFANDLIQYFVFNFTYLISIAFVILSMLIIYPIDKIIERYFVNLAKSKLHENDDLIKIGITGSFGKTSVKEILHSILNEKYYALKSPKNYNTTFGVTKTINEFLNSRHEVFICEMGANRRGDITKLCNIVDIDCGIVTAVGRQHTNTFGGIDNVYLAKKELADYLRYKPCVFNLMNRYISKMYHNYRGSKYGIYICCNRELNSKRILKFSLNKYVKTESLKLFKFYEYSRINCFSARKITLGEICLTFDLWFQNEYLCRIESSLIGLHNVINILLAIAMSRILDVDIMDIKSGVKSITSIGARFEKHVGANGAIIINNGYNSNLDSAVWTLKSLNLYNRPNKVVITPGLIDCEDSYKYNYDFGQLVAKYATEIIITKNVNKKAIRDGLKDAGFDMGKVSFADSFDDVKTLITTLNVNYVVLIENDLPDNYK